MADETLSSPEAEALKEKGNEAYRQNDFATALGFYCDAINLDPTNVKFVLNRSLCYAGMKEWAKSGEDAKTAIKLSPKLPKAHFRLVKALIELGRFKDARSCLANALKECGESKDLKTLEEEIFNKTGIHIRPKSTDFEILAELGDGNFSKVFKTMHKQTKQVYAVKSIERMTVDKMKRRHPNINNEILMEKRVLNKLDHPGIVTLYTTFQDYGTLYYQMEYLEGKDLWTHLQDTWSTSNIATPQLVGCHWSLARFYLAEVISALEYMHRKGIVHRDLKTENMIVTADGHVKLVDFGTAKDLIQTDLNGQEFVGTADYMSPATIASDKLCSIDVDLWSLGVLLFQMFTGSTPFLAASPYLIFLRVKRAQLMIPDIVPESCAQLIRLLLQKDPHQRVRSASNIELAQVHEAPAATLPGLSYDRLRSHAFFAQWQELPDVHTQDPAYLGLMKTMMPDHIGSGSSKSEGEADPTSVASMDNLGDVLATVEGCRDVYKSPAPQAPTLHESYLRKLGQAALELATAMAEHGGSRPEDVEWMQKFDMFALRALDRRRVMYFLNRVQKLHAPGVYRLFCASAMDARCVRTEVATREYTGYTRILQGHFDRDFFLAYLCNPCFGAAAASDTKQEQEQLKPVISTINRLRPKFVVVTGNFTASSPGSEGYEAQVEDFRRTVSRFSDTIPLLFVPGPHDVGAHPTSATLQQFHAKFGADYFGLWYGGLRVIVVNSSLMLHPENAVFEAEQQDIWLTEEIEQAKLCAASMLLVSYHAWYDYEEGLPLETRSKWLKMLRHHKVKCILSSAQHQGAELPADTIAVPDSRHKKLIRRPEYPAELKKADSVEEISDVPVDPDKKPSEVVAADAVAEGELPAAPEVQEESDKEDLPTDDEPQKDGEEEFLNEEPDCEGPELLYTPAVVPAADKELCGVRILHVEESQIVHHFYSSGALPKSIDELATEFAVGK